MSSVRFVFPKVRLAEILRTPGGLPVAEALERAQANLSHIRPTCVAELAGLLELAEATFERMGEDYEEAAVSELYALAVRGIGGGGVCGTPAVDQALTSLCDLLDHLKNAQQFDRESVAVHLQSWRLLLNTELPEAGAASILDGLRKVSARYAA